MRCPRIGLVVLVALAAGARAQAKPAPPPPPQAPHESDFWSEIVEPHGDEVKRLVGKARQAIKIGDEAAQMDAEWAVDQRMRYFADAYHLLRYARRLAPENIDVLGLLGRAADELGKTREAIDALQTAVQIAGADKVGPELVGRLGAIYLRLGDSDAAVRWLRLAQGSLSPQTAQPLVHLANALAARGQVTAAVDALVNAMPSQPPVYYPQELTLVAFSLAVVYDRDEQRAAAFEVLDHMQSTLQLQFVTQVQNALAVMRYAPAEDQHYYQALLYESVGELTEARAEWALYAASGETPWRGRALDHLHAIDAERRLPPRPVVKAPPPVPGTPKVIP